MSTTIRNDIQLHLCQAINQVNQIGKCYGIQEQELRQLQFSLYRILEILDQPRMMERVTQVKKDQYQFFMMNSG
ncbi:hypothetical protein [Laceyella putida]|uniref:Spo0E like sporulation regulatory protein n=2 Tax=Laceyella putida TaxID=110101 RepID=A0ABW2RQZ7_9BACL